MGRPIVDDKEVLHNLNALPTGVAKKVLAKVIRKVQKPMVASARRNVRRNKRSGQLEKSLGIVIRRYRNKLSVWGVLGSRGGFRAEWNGKPVDPMYYAHLVEKSHKLVTLGFIEGTKSVLFVTRLKVPGQTRAYPFLEPAFKQHEARAKAEAIKEIAYEVEREAE